LGSGLRALDNGSWIQGDGLWKRRMEKENGKGGRSRRIEQEQEPEQEQA
jgi:hypothetical protein